LLPCPFVSRLLLRSRSPQADQLNRGGITAWFTPGERWVKMRFTLSGHLGSLGAEDRFATLLTKINPPD